MSKDITKITYKQLIEALMSPGSKGFCIHCNKEIESVIPPQAQRLQCSNCGLYHVYSAEEILKLGIYEA